MSVLIPQLSEGFIGSSGASSSVLCENYSQLSYFVVYSQTGTFIIQGSVDGATWYPLTTVTIASSGTPYFDKINITTKFIRFSYTLGVAGTVISQAFFFDNGSINITNTVGGGVSSVTASGPLASSGGTTPNITISKADATTDGYLSMSDFNTFNSKISGVNTISPILNDGLNPITLTLASSGVSAGTYNYPTLAVNSNGLITSCSSNTPVTSATAGTGISLSAGTGNITITNSLPDQTVAITAGTGISATGTYPNFTITNTAPDQTVTLTAGTNITISGSYPSFTIASTASSTDRCILIAASNARATTSLSYFGFTNDTIAADRTVIGDVNAVVPAAGTIANLYINQQNTQGASTTRTYTLYKNSASTALTCTVAASGTTANNTVNTVSVVAGDVIAIGFIDNNASGSNSRVTASITFTF